MALSGSVVTSAYTADSGSQWKVVLNWTAVQSVTDNTSKISWDLKVSTGSSGHVVIGELRVTIDGKEVYYRDHTNHTDGYNGTKLASGSTILGHNTDGSKSMTIKVEAGIYNWAINKSGTGTFTLDTIPRASTISVTDANIGSVAMIAVSRKSNSYSHSIAYQFGAQSGYITADGGESASEVKLTASSIGFRVPTSFYAQIPNAQDGVCTLMIRTYSGTTQIGEDQTAAFTATAARALCAPDVVGTVVDTNAVTKALTGDSSKLVRYCSTALCTISATAKNSATISQKKIGGAIVSGNTKNLAEIETDSVEFYAKDSRGYDTGAVVSFELIPYVKLTSNPTGRRTDPTSGNAVLSLKGNFFNGSFGAVRNALTAKYRINGGNYVSVTPVLDGNKYTAEVVLSGLDYGQEYSIEVVVSDKVAENKKSIPIRRGIPVFDWGKDDFCFNVPVKLRGGLYPGFDSGFSGDASTLASYLNKLASAGTMTARLGGTYTVSKKIPIPAGMTIMGGTFIADAAFEDAMFSALGDGVRLVGVTMAAPALDKIPKIYVENGVETEALDSNVMGIYSDGWDGIELINCVCDKIIPAKINNGSGTIRGCRITDTSMFVWATNCRMTVIHNDISICDTGLDQYYHVYYLDQDSELLSICNRIRCDTAVAYHDIYHLMTKDNDGTYRAKGLAQGDVITGNFQHIVDSHYVDLILDGCSISNVNPDTWTEFSNMAHSSFVYHNCTLEYANAAAQTYDNSITTPVVYHNCRLTKNASLNRRARYKDCRISQTIRSGGILTNLVDVYNCDMRVSGSPQCIGVISSNTLTANLVGNMIVFDTQPSSAYLLNYAAIDGGVHNNVIIGAKGTQLWHTDRGGACNNIINGTEV